MTKKQFTEQDRRMARFVHWLKHKIQNIHTVTPQEYERIHKKLTR